MGPRRLSTGDGYFVSTRREVKRHGARLHGKRKPTSTPAGSGLEAGEFTISGGGSWQ